MDIITRKRNIGFLFLFVCFLTGCGKTAKPVTEETAVKEELSYFPQKEFHMGDMLPLKEKTAENIYDDYATDQGIFFFSQEDSLLKYEDWENQTVYPLCAKANCTHNSEECTAWFPANKSTPTGLFYDGAYLYFEKDGEAGEIVFYRQNLDGTDRKKIFEVEESFSYGVIYEENQVYYLTSAYKTDSKEWDSESVPKIYHLHCGNLTEEKTTPFPYQWSISNGDLFLLGKYENQIAVRQSVTADKEEVFFLIDLETGQKTGLGEQVTLQSGGWEHESMSCGVIGNFFLDMEVKEKREKNGYTYYPCEIVLESLPETCAYRMEKKVWNIWDLMILDGNVFYYIWDETGKKFLQASYDLRNGAEKVYAEVFSDFYLWGETENWFYGSLFEIEEEYKQVRIRKEDFYAGKANFIERMRG